MSALFLPPLALELLGKRLIASLATLNEDGSIHCVPIWFRWDGQTVLIPTSGKTKKIRNLRRRPRPTVMIDESRAGLDVRGIMLVGSGRLVEGPEALALNRSIHLKYLTAESRDLAEVDEYLKTDDVTIRVVPERVVTWDLSGSPGRHALARRGLALPLDA